MQSFYNFLGLHFEKYRMRYHRLDLMRTEQGKLVGLSEGIGVRSLRA